MSVALKQDVGLQLPSLQPEGVQACSRSYHPSTQYFPSTVPPGYNPNITPTFPHWSTNLEQNQACAYQGKYPGQRFMDPNIVCTQEIDDLNFQCPTVQSTLGLSNTSSTHISLPAYSAMHSNEMQFLDPIIRNTARPLDLYSRNMPISYQNPFLPIWTNETPMKNVQPSRATTPDVSGGIDCPPDVIQSLFNLTPEIPEQIFTLPMLQLKNSASNNILDQNAATSNLEQPKKLNKVEELAKRSHYSKKTLLKIDIPEEPPTKTLFPSYSPAPGGIVLRLLQLDYNQLSTPSGIAGFVSPVVINRVMPQPATQYNSIAQSGSHEGNPIQPTIQEQMMAQDGVQYQPAMQNLLNVAPQYQDSTTPIYQHGTQFPPTMQHLITGQKYQLPDTHIYQHEMQYESSMQNLPAAPQYHNLYQSMYQHGTEASLKTWPTDTSLGKPSYDVTTPTRQLNSNIISKQCSTEKTYSTNLTQNPNWPHRNDNTIYTYAGNLNSKARISRVLTPVGNPSSISTSQYPPKIYTSKSASCVHRYDRNEVSDPYQEYMYMNSSEMMLVDMYPAVSA